MIRPKRVVGRGKTWYRKLLRTALLTVVLGIWVRPGAATAQLPELYYEVDGTGPAIVFIPDWAHDASTWFRLLPRLRDGHRFVRYDPRGQGRSGIPIDDDYSIEAHRADLFRLLDALEIDRAHIVAAGLACRTAIAAALVAPERIVSLTLIEPHLAWDQNERIWWERLIQGWEQSGRPSLGAYATVLVGRWFDESFVNRERWVPDYYDLVLRRQDPDALIASLSDWLAADFAMPETRSPVPVLIARARRKGGVEPLGDPRIRRVFTLTRRVWIGSGGRTLQIEASADLGTRIHDRWEELGHAAQP